ncbi:hypothetical protein [Pseudomonas aeruginosa]|uniref:hypothetical protein n=1 Tax=Pseudomonas aeruginosa TaxID=287 RepID=UPI000B5A6AD1|nr:hypothetical protein [Pseudomonas aeruginosa]
MTLHAALAIADETTTASDAASMADSEVHTTLTVVPGDDLHPGASQLQELEDEVRRRPDMMFGGGLKTQAPRILSRKLSPAIWCSFYGSPAPIRNLRAKIMGYRSSVTRQLAKVGGILNEFEFLSSMFLTNAQEQQYRDVLCGSPFADETPWRKTQEVAIRYARAEGLELPFTGEGDSNLVESSQIVATEWPFMRKMLGAGLLNRTLSHNLVLLSMLRKRIQSPDVRDSERNFVLFLSWMLVRKLPAGFDCLVGVHYPELNEVMPFDYGVGGITAATLGDNAGDFWDRVPGELFELLLEVAIESAREDQVPDEHCAEARAAIERLNGLVRTAISAGTLSAQLSDLLADFTRNTLRPAQSSLIEALSGLAALLDVPVSVQALTENLPRFDLDLSRVPFPAAEKYISRFICAGSLSRISADIAAVKAWEVELGQQQEAICELTKSPSVANMLKIAEEAAKGKERIQQAQRQLSEWVDSTAESQRFYNDILSALASLAAEADQRQLLEIAPTPVVDSVESAPPAPSTESLPAEVSKEVTLLQAQVAQLAEELSTAQADKEHLALELQEKKQELHRLRQVSEATGLAKQYTQSNAPYVDSELLNRVVMRSGVTISDVLAYFAHTAAGRVEILDSVWRVAGKYVGQHDCTERLMDLLYKLIYPYLDAMNSGKPDTQAREIFGPKVYSAKESTSTLTDARLRAMREHTYLGEKVLFQRHLRPSNGHGLEGCRVYFEIIDGMVVIAYVGPHLDVSTSN